MNDDDQPKNKLGYEGEPDYSTLEGARKQESGEHDPVTPRARAASAASSAEKAASASDKISGAPTLAAGDAAKIYKADFKNTVKGVEKGMNQKGLKGNVAKKAAPIVGVLLLVLLPLIAVGSLVAMPFHLLENLKNGFASLFGATSTSAKDSYKAMLHDDTSAGGTLGSSIATSQGYSGIDDLNCADWYAQNVISSECPEAETDASIQEYLRTKALEDSVIADTGTPSASSSAKVFKWTDRNDNVHFIDYNNFDEYWENLEFNDAITRGSLAFTGSFSGWFDDMVQQLTRNLDLRRDQFQGFYEDIDDLESSAKLYREIIEEANEPETLLHVSKEPLNLCADDGRDRKLFLEQQEDAGFLTITAFYANENPRPTLISQPRYQGDCHYIIETTTSTKVGNALSDANDRIMSYLPEMARSFKENESGEENSFGNTCAQLYGISYFSSIVAANRLRQATDFAAKALESIDKTRAGFGSESPINELAKSLSDNGTYEYIDVEKTGKLSENDLSTSSTDLPGLNASALSWVTTGSSVDLEDNSVRKLSLEGILKGFVITEQSGIIASCAIADVLGNFLGSLLNLVLQGNMFFADVSGPENGTLATPTNLINDALSRAAYALVFNPCTSPAGEDVGNCLALGGHYYMSKNHQIGGGSPGDEQKVKEFAKEYRVVIAEQAERERADRSPFDTSSQYTFLGSIVGKIMPYAASLNSSNILSSIGGLVSSSVNSLFPAASALNEDLIASNTGECEYLGSIGAVGDAFCVPYMIMDLDPDNIKSEIKKYYGKDPTPQLIERYIDEHLHGFGNGGWTVFGLSTGLGESKVDADGNPIIHKDYNFAKYIKYCANRLSIFGIVDANILQDYLDGVTSRGWPAILTALLGEKRSYGVLLSVDGGIKEDAMGWSTGRYCVATEDESINSKWGEMQFYQYFMQYQRTNVNRGAYEHNNALGLIQEYQQNLQSSTNVPDSTARLAYTAGMIPEDYVAIENYIAYQTRDKSYYGPSVSTASSVSAKIQFDHTITPLTDFFIDNILPAIQAPITADPKTQGVTA